MTYGNEIDPRKGRFRKKDDSAGAGCYVVLIIIGAMIYFPMKWYKEWTMDPLEYQIKVNVANIRENPNMQSKIVRKAKKGQTFFMFSDSSYSKPDSLWVNGTIEGDTGWIYKELLEQNIWK